MCVYALHEPCPEDTCFLQGVCDHVDDLQPNFDYVYAMYYLIDSYTLSCMMESLMFSFFFSGKSKN